MEKDADSKIEILQNQNTHIKQSQYNTSYKQNNN